ncbi:serine aminopeptidase domain-containing protein [Saccharopolyspora sp. CA-218241]|uniref:serine aminopeptidase domain-containing protein n=1 Tax=Saccharopolyspora sp. CA-218241 TaxID=3240027 RepID=UPI003D967988
MTESGAVPFFHDVEPVQRVRDDLLDVHFTGASTDRRPAVIFVHGMAEDTDPRPRDWDVFRGYGALAAASGLVGVTFDHRLHSGGHFPHAAADVAAVVERTRALEVVDGDRVLLWFFSLGGALAASWLPEPPPWLRGIALTYPVLAPPPDLPGDVARFDAVAAVSAHPGLPKLLVRVGDEIEWLARTQDAFVARARDADAALEVIELPDAAHGFEGHGHDPAARAAVDRAMRWAADALTR